MALRVEHNLGGAGDDLYEALLACHRGLDPEKSARFNARLVLILMNHVGDPATIREALARAALPDDD